MIEELNDQLLKYHDRFKVFSIIMFTEEHPNVIKALKDADYYAALDKLTGDEVLMFATMLFRGEYRYPQPPPNGLAMLMPIWEEPSENKQLLYWFDIDNTHLLPCLVVFATEEKSAEIYCCKHPIRHESVEAVFNSLSEALSPLCQQIAMHRDMDTPQLFKVINWEIKKLAIKRKTMDILRAIAFFRGLAGL